MSKVIRDPLAKPSMGPLETKDTKVQYLDLYSDCNQFELIGARTLFPTQTYPIRVPVPGHAGLLAQMELMLLVTPV